MQYELKTLEDLVQNKINPIKYKSQINEEMLELLLNIVQSEQQRIKVSLVDTVTQLKEERHVNHYIQQHQKGVILLLDTLLILIEQTEETPKDAKIIQGTSIVAVQKTIFLIFEDILHFIENRYLSYCDLSLKIPEKYKQIQIREFKIAVDYIHCKIGGITHELLNMALHPINYLIKKPHGGVSYKEMIYRRELLKGVLCVIDNFEVDKIEHELFKTLTYLNFNSVFFVKYVIKKIKIDLKNYDTILEKTDRLARQLKMYNHIQIRTGYSLHPERNSILEYLTEWVVDELYYWERKHQLVGLNIEQQNELIGKSIKMSTNLTVPQIACFVRLLVEAGAIKGMIKEDIFKFYSTNYSSKFQGNISQGSFHSKYFAIDESVKEDVKELIINMLNKLSKLKPKS